MNDTEPQTAAGKVLLHFTMSLDGLVAGPGHDMDWMTGFSNRPGLLEEYVETTGAVLGGRDGWDATPDDARPYSDAWDGSIFVLTHHPEDATPADGVAFLDCDPAEAVRVGLKAAGGKNLAVLSPTIGRQLLELGLIDEIDLHVRLCCLVTGSGCTTTLGAGPSGSSCSTATTRQPRGTCAITRPRHASPKALGEQRTSSYDVGATGPRSVPQAALEQRRRAARRTAHRILTRVPVITTFLSDGPRPSPQPIYPKTKEAP
jgi:dihydrofolate reductase